MPKQLVVVVVLQADEDGQFNAPEDVGQAVVDAFTAKYPKLWTVSYPAAVVVDNSHNLTWFGKKAPFAAWARAGMRVFRATTDIINGKQPINTIGADRLPYELKVLEVWMPGSQLPAWFKVWEDKNGQQWVLADETNNTP